MTNAQTGMQKTEFICTKELQLQQKLDPLEQTDIQTGRAKQID